MNNTITVKEIFLTKGHTVKNQDVKELAPASYSFVAVKDGLILKIKGDDRYIITNIKNEILVNEMSGASLINYLMIMELSSSISSKDVVVKPVVEIKAEPVSVVEIKAKDVKPVSVVEAEPVSVVEIKAKDVKPVSVVEVEEATLVAKKSIREEVYEMHIDKLYRLLDESEDLLYRLKMLSKSNIEMSTYGGKHFWNEVFKGDNITIQTNVFTKHVRILSKNKRVYWNNGVVKLNDDLRYVAVHELEK